MKLLLINPKFSESFWSFKWIVDSILPSNKRTINPPLGLATLAALCPDDWEVEIIDENIETLPLTPDVHIIGICGMGIQFARQKELFKYYKNLGHYVIAGGSYASLCPEYYECLADSVIAGEAEYIWKEFCRDFESGHPKSLYQETGEVDLNDSPVPRFDLLNLDKYLSISLQFTRGCPFRCEFCDIIVMFGRKPRTKSLEQVGEELDSLRKLNINNIFFVDDNFIGNKPVVKKLLKFLADYQSEHNFKFHFGTEASLNLAHDDELLNLFRDANFESVFVGIESPDEESLKETLKFQNIREDILTSVRKIYSHGIDIYAGFIIGFDNDTTKTFDLQFRFIQDSGIQAAMIGLLNAVPKTPLYERLEKDGRIIKDTVNMDNTKLCTNIIPKQMGYEEMVNGYRDLYFKLLDSKNIAERIINKTTYLKRPIFQATYSPYQQFTMFAKLLVHGIIPRGFSTLYHFSLSLIHSNVKQLPFVIKEWIMAMSMKDYIDRNFVQEFENSHSVTKRYLNSIETSFQRYLKHGALKVSLTRVKNAASNLSISITGLLDRDFYNDAGNHLVEVLENTSSSVTLHIEEIHETHLTHLHELLYKLSIFGDRIYIRVHERLRDIVRVDSSVFNLILES